MAKRVDFSLYLITDRKRFPGDDAFLNAIDEALAAGIRAVQLREKDLPTRRLLEMAGVLRELTSRCGAKLFINDRADIARCVEADGVHLARTSMPVAAVRKVVGEEAMIGMSTHSVEEALSAEGEGADFITFGPLYATPSKERYGPPLGAEALRRARAAVSLPIFGIGGITPSEAPQVLQAGGDGVAVISGILGEADLRSAVERFTEALSLRQKEIISK
jgi:thiamine-phosphate pyrophosphorylase